jgi:hypothetical protein
VIPNQSANLGTLSFARADIQNGSPDVLALVDAANNVVEFLSYEGSFEAMDGPASGQTSTDIGVGEASDTPVGQSLQRTGRGCGGADFSWPGPGPDSFGLPNAGQVSTCDGPIPTPTVPGTGETCRTTAQCPNELRCVDGVCCTSACERAEPSMQPRRPRGYLREDGSSCAYALLYRSHFRSGNYGDARMARHVARNLKTSIKKEEDDVTSSDVPAIGSLGVSCPECRRLTGGYRTCEGWLAPLSPTVTRR